MPKQKIKTISVDTGINPNFLENTLTEDISPLASIFDMIDNSIDAARDHLLRKKHLVDDYGLPADYSGYKIHIRLDLDSIRIWDNCLGMEEEVFSKKMFRIADTSNHSYGIGHYGIGLKRALLKFGTTYALSTDTGISLIKARFNRDGLGNGGDKKFTADTFLSSKKRKTLFSVSDIKAEVKYEINDDKWFENAIKEISTRYSVFVSKGLEITVRSIIHHQFCKIGVTLPQLRTDGNFPPVKNAMITIDDVRIYIESGIHEKYRFPREPGHSITANKALTKSFGLYFICNDRVIVANSLVPAHGWTATWHSEYNGFVCLVRFVSKDPGKMPWSTTKTEIRTDSTIFLKAKDQLQPCADFYRKDIKRRYPAKKQTLASAVTVSTAKPSQVTTTTSLAGNPGVQIAVTQSLAANNPELHVKNWVTLLPKHCPRGNDDVLNAFIIEAIDIPLSATPHAAAMLYRALIELALKRFIYASKNVQNVKDHFYNSTEGKRKNHTAVQQEEQGINPSMIISWLLDNQTVFRDANKSRLVLATKKAKECIAFLNGVVHGLQLIDGRKLMDFRNETFPLLEFLIARDVSV